MRCGTLQRMSERLSPHFSDVEFLDWRHGHVWQTATSRARYLELCVKTLEPLREALGRSIRITSGERKESVTAANSRHMPPELRPNPKERGKPDGSPDAASDIQVGGMAPIDVALAVLKLMGERKIPVGGVGIYTSFVHIDNRGRLASWQGKGVDAAVCQRFKAAVADCSAALRVKAEAGTDDA
jgi:hypothetical protein